MTPDITLMLGDCLARMAEIVDGSIDLIAADLPYGTTSCAWDTVIPFEPLWEHYRRLLRPRGAVVLTASQPFTSALVMSNPKWFKYDLVWRKTSPGGYLNARRRPLVSHESVLVFSGSTPVYYPQMSEADPSSVDRRKAVRDTFDREGGIYGGGKKFVNRRFADTGLRYPTSVMTIGNPKRGSIHPTRKPVALFEYLIRTYSNEGETVLDNCCGSGTTGVACLNTNRRFVGIERDPIHFATAERRIAAAKAESPLFASA